VWARTALACNYYCFFSFAGSCAAGADGVLLPLAALLLLGAVLVAPPDAESFFVASADEDELEDDGGVLESFFDISTDAEPEVELEPAGELGVVEPADEEAPELGVVLETARSPSLSQPVSNPAPSARDTATARAESLICGPPWVGVKLREQGLGPTRYYPGSFERSPYYHRGRQLPPAGVADRPRQARLEGAPRAGARNMAD